MELRELEYFVAVSEELSFTKAAVKCNVGQSALSQSIRGLEKDLGVKLFARDTRRVEMTDAAVALLPAAIRALDAVSAARATVAEISALRSGRLRVGSVPTPDGFDFASLMAEFGALHRGLDLSFVRAHSPLLVEATSEGRLDAAIILGPIVLPDSLTSRPLFTRRCVLVCRADHPLAEREHVFLHELVHERLISGIRGSCTDDMVERVLSAAEEPPAIVQANNPASIFEFVSRGFGVTLIPDGYVTKENADLRQIELADAEVVWTFSLIAREDRLMPATQAFQSFVVAHEYPNETPRQFAGRT